MSRLLPDTNSYSHKLDGTEEKSFIEFVKNYQFDLGSFFDVVAYKNNAMFFGDLKSDVYYISNKLKEMFGFKSNIVKGLLDKWRKGIENEADLELYDVKMKQVFTEKNKIHDLVYKVKDIKGDEHWISFQGKVKWRNNEPIFFVGRITILDDDIEIDPITKLQRKKSAIAKISKYELDKIGVIGFTLHHLRIINDAKGRDYADQFLKAVTDKICKKLNDKMEFYRIEGIKFLAIVNENCLEEIEEIANKIKDIVNEKYSDYNFIFKRNISIGIYIGNKERVVSENILDIFDKIIAVAKENLTENSTSILSDKNILSRHYMNKVELELHRCVHSNFENFRVVLQPIVDRKNKLVSAEVLLRWEYNGELISPEFFVPILERTGLICRVGKFVFEEAAKISHRMKEYKDNFKLNVNISYIQILDDELEDFIENKLKQYKLSGSELVLELTENNYDEDKERVLIFAEKCKKMGMLAAIDDFGTGYSSISFLIRYRANVVKLDKSLIKESMKSRKNKRFLAGIVNTCKNFEMLVCAEGVETEEELILTRELGCDYIQGFYFYKPMEVGQFLESVSR